MGYLGEGNGILNVLPNERQVQLRLLEMAKEVAAILERHEIPYIIVFGTLLGAVRHRGFIPWDDDFDFHLFEDTYEEALKYLREELPADRMLEYYDTEPLYFHQWAHVKDLKSEVERNDKFPHDHAYAHTGLSLDLYIVRQMKRCELEGYLNAENLKYIERRRKLNLMSDSEYERRMAALEDNIRIAREHPVEDGSPIFGFPCSYQCCHYLYEDVFPLKKYAFEDTEFYGPNNADHILANMYGPDYMELPPIEKRRNHFLKVTFNSED